MEKQFFGTTGNGESVYMYTLKNARNTEVKILTYACVVKEIIVDGKTNVVLGYDDIKGYEAGTCFFGSFVGRYANRIKGSRFTLNGKEYNLTPNEGENHLHGIYCKQVFDAFEEGETLVLKRTSPDLEEGYPGTLNMEIRYSLSDDNALEIEYRAVCDKDTVINLTNHSYFNLNGDKGTILNHTLSIASDRFTECDEQTIPTGRILSVEGTPMDFRTPKTIGQDINADYKPIRMTRGYDHNFILTDDAKALKLFATAKGDKSGITMQCFTDQPAVQLYTGNFVDGDEAPGKTGSYPYPQYAAFCLETQHYPASPNYPEFPSAALKAGELYNYTTVYKFN